MAPQEIPPEAETPPPPKTVCVAVLDGEGRYFGKKEVAADAVPPGAVEVPKHCDLPEDGTYQWRSGPAAFFREQVPGQIEPVDLAAETVAALAGIGFALRAADMPLPPLTLKWLRWFETTLDYTGLLSKDAGGLAGLDLVKPSAFKK